MFPVVENIVRFYTLLLTCTKRCVMQGRNIVLFGLSVMYSYCYLSGACINHQHASYTSLKMNEFYFHCNLNPKTGTKTST